MIPCPTRLLTDFHTLHRPSPEKLGTVRTNPHRENPRLTRLLREPAPAAAPIPVTHLWTACTRLKIRGLQTQSFH
jgi:hypothetical protein